MRYVGTDPETMFLRTTVVSLALQALIERLLLQGTLTVADLGAMRGMGLQLAADLQAQSGTLPQVGGARLAREIMAWWEVLGAPEPNANDP
jgi:hypothetical protein